MQALRIGENKEVRVNGKTLGSRIRPPPFAYYKAATIIWGIIVRSEVNDVRYTLVFLEIFYHVRLLILY